MYATHRLRFRQPLAFLAEKTRQPTLALAERLTSYQRAANPLRQLVALVGVPLVEQQDAGIVVDVPNGAAWQVAKRLGNNANDLVGG